MIRPGMTVRTNDGRKVGHLVAIGQQTPGQMETDEAGRPGDEHAHASPLDANLRGSRRGIP